MIRIKRILAILLTTCMLVESTATVSAVGEGQAEENAIVPVQDNGEAADGTEAAAKDTIEESPEEGTGENSRESLEGETEENSGESLEERTEENSAGSLEEKAEEGNEELTAGDKESETGNEASVEEDTEDLEDAKNPEDLEDALAGQEEAEDDEEEIETKEAEPIAQPEHNINQETYAADRAASSAEIREINLGFYGMSNPEAADGTSYWQGSRVSFGEARGEMSHPENLGIDKKVYENTWKVLDVEKGLLWADVNEPLDETLKESLDGISAFYPWEECALYAYLNADYKQNTEYFKETDRQAINGITLLNAEDLQNTAYGFTDSTGEDNTRSNGGNKTDYNLLLPESASKLTFVNTEGEIWDYSSTSVPKTIYYIPAMYLDTSRVLYSMLNGTIEKYDSGKFTLVDNLEESAGSSWELILKSDDDGFAAELPDSIPEGGALSVQVTSTGSGDYKYMVAMLTDSAGTVVAYAKSETVDGTIQFNLPTGIATGSYHLTVFEESGKSSGTWGASSSYASNVIEKDVKVSGMEITDFQVSEQTYGSVKLYWELENISEFGQVSCNIYRSETEDGEYTLVDTMSCAWGNPLVHLDPCYVWEDTDVQRAEGTKNKTYYYKICIANENGTESAYTGAVTNKDMYYGIIRTETMKYDYIGGYIADARGNKLEELELPQGGSQELYFAWVKEDETTKVLDKNSSNCAKWYLFEEYCSTKQLEDKNPPDAADDVQIIPVGFAEANDSYIEFINYKVKIKDFSGAVGDTYYLTVSMYESEENETGSCYWQIPVCIVEGDEENVEESGEILIYRTKSEFAQDVRDEMVNRTEEFTFLVKEGDDEDWWIARADGEDEYGDIWDFYQEREGMKPNEGDYLDLTRGKAGEVSFIDEWLAVKSVYFDSTGDFYHKYVFTPHFITTKDEEDWVDEQIKKIIWTEGGALYNYRNASDFNKIRAAYNYVRNNVGYRGTTDPIYHTCYSALKNKVATCQGYALLFYRLARELGIPNRVLMGTDANAHTYNIVQLENAWYYLDTSAGVFLKGENDFDHTDLQSHYQTDTFKQEYLSKVSQTSYNGSADIPTSGISGMETLTDAQIVAIDANIKSADNMSAQYKIGNGSISVSGTIKYTEGCSGYLGYAEEAATAGHFLAVRIKVDASKFTDDGRLSILYPGKDGEQVEKSYQKTDGSTLKDGYVDVILNVTESPEITIKVDYDTDAEEDSEYEAASYLLDLSKLKKEEQGRCAGNVTEVSESEYGIEISSPSVQMSKDGTEIRVSYDAVAYSSNVALPGKEAVSGNYVALQLSTPDCVKPTVMLTGTTVEETTTQDDTTGDSGTTEGGGTESGGTESGTTEGSGTEGGTTEGSAAETATAQAAETDLLKEIAGDYSYIRFIIPVQDTLSKEFTITWGGSHPYAWEQKLIIETTEDCILETLNENALLPSSIAFNGLNTTMYVGQSQCIHTTIKKKYEQDVTQLFYTSDASDVVSVNRVTGVLKALKQGTANISVSAIDKSGNTITKTAKITVKALTAPTGIKVSSLKDTSAVLSWKANTTGQYMEVYAIPYDASVFGTKKADWKSMIEDALETAGMDGQLLSALEEDDKTAMLNSLQQYFKTGQCLAQSVTSDKKNLTIQGLQAETEYIFYLRNASAATAFSIAFAGAVSDKITTKGRIFASVELTVTPQETAGITQTVEDGTPVYTITAEGQSTSVTIGYQFLDEDGKEITGSAPTFQSVKFNSGNTKIAKVNVLSSDKTKGTLSYGTQVGDARITVTGKDASGTVRTSEPVIVRVVKAPTKLTNKTTTLTIGQSVRLGELIGTDIKGSLQGMDLGSVDFDAALQSILRSGCFASSQAEGETSATQDTEITATALINNKNNGSIDVAFSMGASTATAKIKVKDMAAPSIGKVTVKDTSATISFTPAATVRELSASKYYTVTIVDKATGETLDVRDITNADTESADTADADTASADTVSPYTCSFSADSWTCKVEGLSSNKTYEAVITAHFVMDGKTNVKSSKSKKFTTTKPLLITEGSIGVNYISLEELRAEPNAAGTAIDYEDEDGISIENNRTYVFMAQVSNLARALGTDKLKWTISSGDKKAASIKAASSTFEMQLTTTKTGTFTITAASTVTKETVATFKVNVIPYQSGGKKTAQENPVQEVAYFPAADDGIDRKKEDIA